MHAYLPFWIDSAAAASRWASGRTSGLSVPSSAQKRSASFRAEYAAGYEARIEVEIAVGARAQPSAGSRIVASATFRDGGTPGPLSVFADILSHLDPLIANIRALPLSMEDRDIAVLGCLAGWANARDHRPPSLERYGRFGPGVDRRKRRSAEATEHNVTLEPHHAVHCTG